MRGVQERANEWFSSLAFLFRAPSPVFCEVNKSTYKIRILLKKMNKEVRVEDALTGEGGGSLLWPHVKIPGEVT